MEINNNAKVMRLATYLFKKLAEKLPARKQGGLETAGEGKGMLLGNMRGDLDLDILMDREIKKVDEKTGGGWRLNVDSYVKEIAAAMHKWELELFYDTANGDLFARAQTAEDVNFLFWNVCTAYSFDTWVKLPKDFFYSGDCRTRVKELFDFVSGGSDGKIGDLDVVNRVRVAGRRGGRIQLGNIDIRGKGRHGKTIVVVNF